MSAKKHTAAIREAIGALSSALLCGEAPSQRLSEVATAGLRACDALVATVERLERERDKYARIHVILSDALNAAEARLADAEKALRYIDGEDVAGYEAHMRPEEVARAYFAPRPSAEEEPDE